MNALPIHEFRSLTLHGNCSFTRTLIIHGQRIEQACGCSYYEHQ